MVCRKIDCSQKKNRGRGNIKEATVTVRERGSSSGDGKKQLRYILNKVSELNVDYQ